MNEADRANLVAYLDGELDERASAEIEAKLAVDPAARAELEALRQVYGLLDYLPQPEPSPNFTNRTLEKLTGKDLPRLPRPTPVSAGGLRIGGHWLSWAAALLLATGIGYGASRLFWRPVIAEPVVSDEKLTRYLRVVERWRDLDQAGDLEFLRGLDSPEVFGDELDS